MRVVPFGELNRSVLVFLAKFLRKGRLAYSTDLAKGSMAVAADVWQEDAAGGRGRFQSCHRQTTGAFTANRGLHSEGIFQRRSGGFGRVELQKPKKDAKVLTPEVEQRILDVTEDPARRWGHSLDCSHTGRSSAARRTPSVMPAALSVKVRAPLASTPRC